MAQPETMKPSRSLAGWILETGKRRVSRVGESGGNHHHFTALSRIFPHNAEHSTQCLNLAGIARSVLTLTNQRKRGAMNSYQIITDSIVKQLESGVVPWRKPWRTDVPMSLASLKPYRGLNVLLLASQGYASRYWLTFNPAA